MEYFLYPTDWMCYLEIGPPIFLLCGDVKATISDYWSELVSNQLQSSTGSERVTGIQHNHSLTLLTETVFNWLQNKTKIYMNVQHFTSHTKEARNDNQSR